MKPWLRWIALAALSGGVGLASAKLPPPSDEAKAKAAEAAAKTAHAGKVDAYLLCKSMDKVAADYFAATKKAGTEAKAPVATPPCVDPGAFVYTPPVAGVVAAAPAAAPPAAPAVAAPGAATAAAAPLTAAAPAAPAVPVKK